jgi:hypothetical protein
MRRAGVWHTADPARDIVQRACALPCPVDARRAAWSFLGLGPRPDPAPWARRQARWPELGEV